MTGANRLVDGGDGGDTYNYSPPDDDLFVDRARLGARRARSSPDRCAPGSSSSPCTGGRATPSATSAGASAAARRPRSSRCARRSSCMPHERFVRVRVEFDNRCRDHRLRRALPAAGAGRPLGRRVRVRGRRTRTARPRADPTRLPLPTFVSRRFVDCSDGELGLAAPARRPARVRGASTAPSSRSRCCAPPATCRERSSRRARTPRGRSTRSKARSCRGATSSSTRCMPHRGDWRAARLHDAADEFLVPLERVRGGVPGGPRPADREDAAGHRRAGLGRRTRAGRPRRPRVQPVAARDHRRDRARRRTLYRLDRRPHRRPARVVQRRGRARPVGDRDPAPRLSGSPPWPASGHASVNTSTGVS